MLPVNFAGCSRTYCTAATGQPSGGMAVVRAGTASTNTVIATANQPLPASLVRRTRSDNSRQRTGIFGLNALTRMGALTKVSKGMLRAEYNAKYNQDTSSTVALADSRGRVSARTKKISANHT